MNKWEKWEIESKISSDFSGMLTQGQQEVVDYIEQLQQKVNQLEQDKTHLIEIISGLINYVKDTYDEDLTDKTAEVMEIVLSKGDKSNE